MARKVAIYVRLSAFGGNRRPGALCGKGTIRGEVYPELIEGNPTSPAKEIKI